MNKIFIINGNKGGIGKSLFAMLIADFIIRLGLSSRLLCGDAEMSVLQRTFGMQMLNNGLVDEEQIRAFDFMSDVGMEDFVDAMSGMEDILGVIDTGANMQRYITSQADFLADCAEYMGDVTMVFVVSPAEESAIALQDFLVAFGGKFRIRVVLISPEDIPAQNYALLKDDVYEGTRVALEKLGCPIHFIGKIPERFFQMMMRGDRKLPSQILSQLEGKAVRRRFACWLREALNPIMNEVLGFSEPESEIEPDQDFEDIEIEPDMQLELEVPNA